MRNLPAVETFRKTETDALTKQKVLLGKGSKEITGESVTFPALAGGGGGSPVRGHTP